jgi:hypothetical protein
MFLGGSYHDRDNPHMWGVSHDQFIVFITLGCNQKEGRQQSSRGLRTSVADDAAMRMKMMMMKMTTTMTIFYRGIGTKCTESQNSNTKTMRRWRRRRGWQLQQRRQHDGTRQSAHHNNTNTNSINNKNRPNEAVDDAMQTDDGYSQTRRTRTHVRMVTATTPMMNRTMAHDNKDDANTTTTKNIHSNTTNMRASRQVTTLVARLDRHEMRRTTRITDGATNKQEGRMTMMWMTAKEMIPSATGTLDRKTSQASPKACLYTNQHKKTREA